MSIKKILTRGCIYYTVLITAVYSFALLVENGAHWVPTLRMAYCLLGFSMCFSLLNEFLSSDKLIFSLRLTIHFILTGAIYYLMFVLGGGFQSNGGSVVVAMGCYLFVYAIGTLLVLMIRYLTGDSSKKQKGSAHAPNTGKSDNTDEYQTLFTNKK